jgi:MOSC domain-containing protein YiiM
LKAQILSLNVGLPKTIEWNGKSIETSMKKEPVSQLTVRELSIDGDKFSNPNFHGTPDAVLYAFGVDALDAYFSKLGLSYVHGDLGENLTLDRLDEREVSVGDVFKIGEVFAQATFPRIPCAKINFRLGHELGQKTMIETKRSGVYFRILKPGVIKMSDSFERVEKSETPFSIYEVYERMVGGVKVSDADRERVKANGTFPLDRIVRWFR